MKKTIFYLQWVLIVLSIIALGCVTAEAFSLNPDFSPQGFKNLMALFKEHAVLFAATFIVITTNLAIARLDLMEEANKNALNASTNTFKASNRVVWMQTVKEFFSEVKEDDPYLCKQISRNLINIHDYLFTKNYKMSDRNETKEFFDRFFAQSVIYFEEMNTKYMHIGSYKSREHSYSWGNFQYLIITMMTMEDTYADFRKDLHEFYMLEVRKNPSAIINEEMYKIGLEGYLKYKPRKKD